MGGRCYAYGRKEDDGVINAYGRKTFPVASHSPRLCSCVQWSADPQGTCTARRALWGMTAGSLPRPTSPFLFVVLDLPLYLPPQSLSLFCPSSSSLFPLLPPSGRAAFLSPLPSASGGWGVTRASRPVCGCRIKGRPRVPPLPSYHSPAPHRCVTASFVPLPRTRPRWPTRRSRARRVGAAAHSPFLASLPIRSFASVLVPRRLPLRPFLYPSFA
ncbi:hypothetical protein DFH09DRAFT_1159923 [Mycena vulgaris]|nr:hypothetical protein DFH09DRAFT_1159923 [Mycena vulgaris]